MIKKLFIVPREGETIEEAFDRQYPEKNIFEDVYEDIKYYDDDGHQEKVVVVY